MKDLDLKHMCLKKVRCLCFKVVFSYNGLHLTPIFDLPAVLTSNLLTRKMHLNNNYGRHMCIETFTKQNLGIIGINIGMQGA